MRGEIPEFTGVTSPYEEPQQPELIVETDLHSADELVEEILAYLIRQGLVAESS
jgi:adenylylsulfate kinase